MHNKSHKLMALFTVWGLLAPLSKISADSNGILRDPTQPSSYSAAVMSNMPNSDIMVSAIFVGKNRKVAIIGDHAFTVGEKVSELTIVAIDADGITLKKEDGSEFRVDIPFPTVKLPTTKRNYRENLD
jgi:hypothetical protein